MNSTPVIFFNDLRRKFRIYFEVSEVLLRYGFIDLEAFQNKIPVFFECVFEKELIIFF